MPRLSPTVCYAGPFRDAGNDRAIPFFGTDIHFNELGNALVARELSRAYPEFFDPIKIDQTR